MFKKICAFTLSVCIALAIAFGVTTQAVSTSEDAVTMRCDLPFIKVSD